MEPEGRWESFSEDFTAKPDFMPGPRRSEQYWMYHIVYGLSAGFPLCCVLAWTRNSTKHYASRHREGINNLGQHFVVCDRETHEPTYVFFVAKERRKERRRATRHEPLTPPLASAQHSPPLPQTCDQCDPENHHDGETAV